MTATVTTLKVSHFEAIVKVVGAANDTATVTLASLLPYSNNVAVAGTLATSSSSSAVTGTGTEFASNNWVNAKIYKEDGTYLGMVSSVTNATSLTLTSNAAATYTGAVVVQFPMDVLDGTKSVTITGVTFTGAAAGVATISRNGNRTMTLLAENQGQFDFSGQMMCPDSTNSDQDIAVAVTGGNMEVWLRLKKVSGYTSTVEYEKYGAYDNELRLGASTTVSGSPDKV